MVRLHPYIHFCLIEDKIEYESISYGWFENNEYHCMIRQPDDCTTMRQEILAKGESNGKA